MTDQGSKQASHDPSLRDRLRPAELLIFALVLALFGGITVLFSARDIMLALIFFVIIFIVSLVGLALFGLAIKPEPGEADTATDAAADAEQDAQSSAAEKSDKK